MRFSVKAHHLPQRVATGAFILNSGIGKLRADEEAAAQLHGFAAGAYPFVNKLKPADFTRLLAVGEITLGAALLLPVVPAAVAGEGWRRSPAACSACTPGRPACASRTVPSRPSRESRWPRTRG